MNRGHRHEITKSNVTKLVKCINFVHTLKLCVKPHINFKINPSALMIYFGSSQFTRLPYRLLGVLI